MDDNFFKSVRGASDILSRSPGAERNAALSSIAEALEKNRDRIKAANERDLAEAERKGEKQSLISRLRYTDGKMAQSIKGLEDVETLPDPVFRIREKREIDKGFVLEKVSVPLGVIGMVFEARPDALIQIASLALKSGNGLILKGEVKPGIQTESSPG